jgi:transposase
MSAILSRRDVILVADYHDQNVVIRWFNEATGEERLLRCRVNPVAIHQVVQRAVREASDASGKVVWIMESTTGWARVRTLIGRDVRFLVANVLQMPQSPKAHRRKTDKIDTARILREYLCGTLPLSFQPTEPLRAIRRLVALRESLVARRTALRNWIDRTLAHETWRSRSGWGSARGMRRLKSLLRLLPDPDRAVFSLKLRELDHLAQLLDQVTQELLSVYNTWPAAQRLDEIPGIGPISAVSILARIGPIERFRRSEELIAFAGLAPGVRESDGARREGRIGGGGTDKHLRHYLIEATFWARRVPRYNPTYQRVLQKRGPKIARIVVARMLLRSIQAMLRGRVRFDRQRVA